MIEIFLFEIFNYQKLILQSVSYWPSNEVLERVHTFNFFTLIAISVLITGIQNIEGGYTLWGVFYVILYAVLFAGAFPGAQSEFFHNKRRRIVIGIVILSFISLDLYRTVP